MMAQAFSSQASSRRSTIDDFGVLVVVVSLLLKSAGCLQGMPFRAKHVPPQRSLEHLPRAGE